MWVMTSVKRLEKGLEKGAGQTLGQLFFSQFSRASACPLVGGLRRPSLRSGRLNPPTKGWFPQPKYFSPFELPPFSFCSRPDSALSHEVPRCQVGRNLTPRRQGAKGGKHRTTNIERPTSNGANAGRSHWMFDVGCFLSASPRSLRLKIISRQTPATAAGVNQKARITENLKSSEEHTSE